MDEVTAWERQGKDGPPPHRIKQDILRSYAKTHNIKVLVESGTYLGDMVEAMKDDFDRIISIELSESLHMKAKQRFQDVKHVELLLGDSGCLIGQVVRALSRPALFWLDGHYSAGITARGSKDTPIVEELSSILGSTCREHVILIDDARCFGVEPDYPTQDELFQKIRSLRNDVEIEVAFDCIRITPNSSVVCG